VYHEDSEPPTPPISSSVITHMSHLSFLHVHQRSCFVAFLLPLLIPLAGYSQEQGDAEVRPPTASPEEVGLHQAPRADD
jgi:hypothetical protein